MTKKIYPEDQAKMRANRAKAGEIRLHNQQVDRAKRQRKRENAASFVPRKAPRQSEGIGIY